MRHKKLMRHKRRCQEANGYMGFEIRRKMWLGDKKSG
jgi:hypothetical protein